MEASTPRDSAATCVHTHEFALLIDAWQPVRPTKWPAQDLPSNATSKTSTPESTLALPTQSEGHHGAIQYHLDHRKRRRPAVTLPQDARRRETHRPRSLDHLPDGCREALSLPCPYREPGRRLATRGSRPLERLPPVRNALIPLLAADRDRRHAPSNAAPSFNAYPMRSTSPIQHPQRRVVKW